MPLGHPARMHIGISRKRIYNLVMEQNNSSSPQSPDPGGNQPAPSPTSPAPSPSPSSAPTPAAGAKPAAAKNDKRVKLVFLVVIVGVLAFLYWKQTRGYEGVDWPTDLAAQKTTAAKEDRKLLVYFTASTPSDDDKRMAQVTLAKKENRSEIEKGRFVLAKVVVKSDLTDDVAREYKIKKLPTFLILDPKGKELNRREGLIGEVPFRNGFLDCKEIVVP